MTLELTFVERRKIEDKRAGLTEPSGLALAADGGFWTVSDDTKMLFHLDRDSRIDDTGRFKLSDKGFEGLTSYPDGRHLFAVDEESNRLIKFDLSKGKVTNRRRLADMVGYDRIARLFENDKDDNMGLEGIAWNLDTGTLFCLKEGNPGMLLEVSPDFMTVRLHAKLGERNGFGPRGKKGKDPDFSGIAYDQTRGAFWIVSDEAERLYLYQPVDDRVLDSTPLEYPDGVNQTAIRNAEGVVFEPDTGRIHIVTDEGGAKKRDATLYTFEVK
jgi:uncharacterized protein YjiK